MTLNAIVVEDEPLAMEELVYLIKKNSEVNIVAQFADGLEAFKFLQQQQVDVAFLDINVPSIDGMLLARNIAQFAKKPAIIFTTAYKDYAAEAFEVEAFDYILKPFNEQRIKAVLDKLVMAPAQPVTQPAPAPLSQEQAGLTQEKINVTRDGHIYLLDVHDICYAEAAEKQTKIYTEQAEYVMSMSISEVMQRLPDTLFFRTHRSYLVNIDKIQEIIPWYNSTYLVQLYGCQAQLPVSRGRLKAFRALLHL